MNILVNDPVTEHYVGQFYENLAPTDTGAQYTLDSPALGSRMDISFGALDGRFLLAKGSYIGPRVTLITFSPEANAMKIWPISTSSQDEKSLVYVPDVSHPETLFLVSMIGGKENIVELLRAERASLLMGFNYWWHTHDDYEINEATKDLIISRGLKSMPYWFAAGRID